MMYNSLRQILENVKLELGSFAQSYCTPIEMGIVLIVFPYSRRGAGVDKHFRMVKNGI